jgi:BMFP domain-containing protein YqiC
MADEERKGEENREKVKSLEMRVAELEDRLAGINVTEEELLVSPVY